MLIHTSDSPQSLRLCGRSPSFISRRGHHKTRRENNIRSQRSDAFGQRIVSTIFTQSNQYRVILETDKALQRDLSSLSQIYLPGNSSTKPPKNDD